MLALALVYGIGLFIPVMEVDAAQYAAMSREMLETGNYLELYNRGKDYLDKPPLVFWLSALSFRLFGVSTWAFKLPSVLFSLWAVFSTYQLGKRLHSATVGRWAAWMLATCQAWFLMNVDPRTDMLLAGSVTYALWQLVAYQQDKKWTSLIAASVGIGLAMLAKGPIGLMVPALALGTHWLIRQEWQKLLHAPWLVLLGIVALLLAPMAYGLYVQFDLHPDKVVYGESGVSGLRFYFWDQSFGRLTGDNQFINQAGKAQQGGDPFFFVHTFIWSFFPWSWLFVVVVVRKLIQRIREGFPPVQKLSFVTWAGVFLPWIALSFSAYKLPHYIFVFYPLAAILLAKEMAHFSRTGWAVTGQRVVLALAILVAGWLLYSFTPDSWALVVLTIIIGLVLIYTRLAKNATLPKWTAYGVAAMLLVNVIMNGHFYRQLLTYQVPSHVVREVKRQSANPSTLYMWPTVSYAFEFYRGAIQDTTDIYALQKRERVQLLIPEKAWTDFLRQRVPYQMVRDSIPGIKVTRLQLPFLWPATRHQQVRHWRWIALGDTPPE